MRAISSVILLIVLAATAHAEPDPIIDVHLHAFPASAFGEAPPPNPLTNQPTPVRTDAELRVATFAELERAGVVRAVASGPLSIVKQWHEANPTLIVPAVYLGEIWEFHSAERLRPLFQNGELAVLGELGLQYVGLSPGDEPLRAHFQLAAELDIPVGIHTGLGSPGIPNAPCCGEFRLDLGKPNLLEEVVKRHPSLRVYIMHAGYPYLQETIALLYVYPQARPTRSRYREPRCQAELNSRDSSVSLWIWEYARRNPVWFSKDAKFRRFARASIDLDSWL